MLPITDVERVLQWARTKQAPVSLQTNGTLITARHLDLFAEYGVSVGISVDGPGDLNHLRWLHNAETTNVATDKSLRAIDRLIDAGRPPSLIVTISRMNAVGERLDRLVDWIEGLIARGIKHWNFHTLEVDSVTAAAHQVSDAEAAIAIDALLTLEEQAQARTQAVRFSPWEDMRRVLLGKDTEGVNCIWHACDPLTTDAVRGIDGQGHRHNCGRTNKDGVRWIKADQAGHERQLALYLTPQAYGGCAGCRFFFACKGECPGTAESGDWRNRTAHCAILLQTFALLEQQLVRRGETPLSVSVRRASLDAALLAGWEAGQGVSLAAAMRGRIDRPHGDQPHGDRPHGDHHDKANITHGDHTDAARVRR